ncbi:13178_t:CDS:1, partial [Racocetra fulgida]
LDKVITTVSKFLKEHNSNNKEKKDTYHILNALSKKLAAVKSSD